MLTKVSFCVIDTTFKKGLRSLSERLAAEAWRIVGE
jgi:hypothetical protein